MAKPTDHSARDERLAAKLRENLHRRKAQARGVNPSKRPIVSNSDTAENDSGALSKQPPES